MTRQELVRLANKCPHSITMSLDEFRKNEGNYIRLLEVYYPSSFSLFSFSSFSSFHNVFIKGKTTTQLLFLETNRDIMTNTQEKWLRETMDEIQSKDEKNYLSTLVFMRILIPASLFLPTCTLLPLLFLEFDRHPLEGIRDKAVREGHGLQWDVW